MPLRGRPEGQQLRTAVRYRCEAATAHAMRFACLRLRCGALPTRLTHSALTPGPPRAAFSCYVRSDAPEKGTDCAQLFLTMQARRRTAAPPLRRSLTPLRAAGLHVRACVRIRRLWR